MVESYVEQVESLKAEIEKLKTNLSEERQFFQKERQFFQKGLNKVRRESASKKELDCVKKGYSIHHDILLFTL